MDEKLCKPCLIDVTKKQADGFCINCAEYLCNACCHDHRKNKLTRRHAVLQGAEIPNDDSIYRDIVRLTKCKIHPEKDIDFECSVHDLPICISCLRHSHRQCEKIVEIATVDTTTIGDDLQNRLKRLKNRSTHVTQITERKMQGLQNEQTKVQKACLDFSIKVKNCIDTLTSELNETIKTNIDQEMMNVEADNDVCKGIDNKMTIIEDMLKAANFYEDNLTRFIVRKTIDTKMQEIDQSLQQIHSKPFNVYSFEPEDRLLEISSLGKLLSTPIKLGITSVEVPDSKREEVTRSKNGESTYSKRENVKDANSNHVQSLECIGAQATKAKNKHMTSTLATGMKNIGASSLKDDKVKSFLTMNVLKSAERIKIRSTSDATACNIVASFILPDTIGSVLVLDSQNRKIKVLDNNLQIQQESKLSDKPVDMSLTYVKNASIAHICFTETKGVSSYNITDASITSAGYFQTKTCPMGITSCSSILAILFRDKITPSGTHVEIRNANGKFISIVNCYCTFPCYRIRLLDEKTLITLNNTQINCFQLINGGSESILKPKWYFKDHTGCNVKNVSDVAFDDDRNVYTCAMDSNNIHQVDSRNFMLNRVILSISQPTTLAIDSKKQRLIVGSFNDDCMHCYMFKWKVSTI